MIQKKYWLLFTDTWKFSLHIFSPLFFSIKVLFLTPYGFIFRSPHSESPWAVCMYGHNVMAQWALVGQNLIIVLQFTNILEIIAAWGRVPALVLVSNWKIKIGSGQTVLESSKKWGRVSQKPKNPKMPFTLVKMAVKIEIFVKCFVVLEFFTLFVLYA